MSSSIPPVPSVSPSSPTMAGSSRALGAVQSESQQPVPYDDPEEIRRFIQPSDPSDQRTDEQTAHSRIGRLHQIWYDILFSKRTAAAVTCLHTYGYLISIIMTLSGWSFFTQFGRVETITAKLVMQIIGLLVSFNGVYGCYKNEPKRMTYFVFYQCILLFNVTVALIFLMSLTSRRKLFHVYTTEPYYNMKLVDQPYVTKFKVLDMGAEPAYEISLLYFRACYMLIVTSIFNIYSMYAVIRKMVKHVPSRAEENIEMTTRGQGEDVENVADRRVSWLEDCANCLRCFPNMRQMLSRG